MRSKTTHAWSQWFRSISEKLFRMPKLWLSNPSLGIQEIRIMLHSSLTVWSETAYRSRCCGQALCLVSPQTNVTFLFCWLTVALVIVSDPGNLGRFGTSEPYVEYSDFYTKKLCQPGQVKLYMIYTFTKRFLWYLLQQSFLLWIDVRETQQDTGRYEKIATRAEAN